MRILVTAASRHRSTEQIAGAIAQGLTKAGIATSPTELARVHSLDGYDAVVLGSGVYAGRWLPEANDFVEKFRADLASRPLWLFSSGPVGDPPRSEAEPREAAHLAAELDAVEHRVFSGRLHKAELGLLSRVLVKVTRSPYGDFRDWESVEHWAASIAEYLATTQRPG